MKAVRLLSLKVGDKFIPYVVDPIIRSSFIKYCSLYFTVSHKWEDGDVSCRPSVPFELRNDVSFIDNVVFHQSMLVLVDD